MRRSRESHPTHLAHLATLFESSTSVPLILNLLSADGKVKRYLPQLSYRDRLFSTAAQSHALSEQNPDAYFHKSIQEQRLPSPDVTDFELLPYHHVLTPNTKPEEVKAKILSFLQLASDNLVGKQAYTPFMVQGQQLEISDYIKQTLTNFSELVNNTELSVRADLKKPIQILAEPYAAEISLGITRAFLFPMDTPYYSKNISEEKLDSGNCDNHLNTSFRRGDEVRVLARAKIEGQEYVFVESNNRTGWIGASHIIPTSYAEVNLNFAQPHLYTGSQPIFGEYGQLILPGDTVYCVRDKFGVKLKQLGGYWRLQPIAELSRENTQIMSDKAVPNLQAAVDFAYGLQLPYMWAVFDCSEVMRRVGLILGFDLQKFSGDAMVQVEEMFGQENKFGVENAQQLIDLDDGVYLTNLLNPAGYSMHMYLVTKKDSDISAFSYAYDLQGDSGYEKPIGPHVCGLDGFARQFEKKRRLVMTKIAAAKN